LINAINVFAVKTLQQIHPVLALRVKLVNRRRHCMDELSHGLHRQIKLP
jgi:hypothetical protein